MRQYLLLLLVFSMFFILPSKTMEALLFQDEYPTPSIFSPQETSTLIPLLLFFFCLLFWVFGDFYSTKKGMTIKLSESSKIGSVCINKFGINSLIILKLLSLFVLCLNCWFLLISGIFGLLAVIHNYSVYQDEKEYLKYLDIVKQFHLYLSRHGEVMIE